MARQQVQNSYSGRVQGVGFRYTVKTVAMGYEVVGAVKNLPDGRVELIAEGERQELEDFLKAIRESELRLFIREETCEWRPAEGIFRGFAIAG